MSISHLVKFPFLPPWTLSLSFLQPLYPHQTLHLSRLRQSPAAYQTTTPSCIKPSNLEGVLPRPELPAARKRVSRAEISEHPEKKPIICPFFCLNQRKQHIDSACLSHPKTHLDLLVPSYAQRTVSSSLIRFEPSYLCLYFVPVDPPLVIAPAPPDCYRSIYILHFYNTYTHFRNHPFPNSLERHAPHLAAIGMYATSLGITVSP